MSLRKRIQILLAFLVGLPLLLLLYESYQTGRKTLVTQMKQEALQIARLQTAEMDLTFDPPRLIAEGLVRAVETDPVLRSDNIRELLRRTLHESPDIYGVAIALDPALTPLKRFAPYVFRRKGVETEITLPYDYLQQEWYRLPLKSGRGKWIKPYFGEGGEALMVTYVAPLRRNGIVVGMVAVDLDLESLLKRLHFLKPGGDGTVYLVNKAGKILAHPALKALADLPGNQGLGEMAAVMAHSGMDTVKMVDPVSHRTSWVVESPIRSLSAERGGGDWSLIVSWPLDKRLAPLTGMGRRMLILYLFLGGAALWFLNRTFEDNISRPLRHLAEQAHRYAAGDFRQHAVMRDEALELRELGTALNALGADLEKKMPQTQATTEDAS
jgi:HAMP domain-containing protein